MEREWKIMDGNQAAATVAYAYSDVAAVYPITPSSPMAEWVDMWAAQGKENCFGQPVLVTEMQSEAGAASAVHGALITGSLATTYSSSQGLLLMIPGIYRMAGEHLPGVIHVAARAVSTHALSIFGDHSDIYACRQTGAAILASASVQEVMDLAPVAHMAALLGKLPFLHFFDGFRTSHEIQKIRAWSQETLKEFLGEQAVADFRKKGLHPECAKEMGTSQEPDVYFQIREASNLHYERIASIVESCMEKINEMAGSAYHLFDYYGTKDAEHVIIAMGSVCETIEEVIDVLAAAGEKAGLIKVRLYRPFSTAHFLRMLPGSVKQISVLDRTKEPGAVGEPLYVDVAAAIKDSPFFQVPVFHGRYGLSSRDTTPAQIRAVYKNREKKEFTIGIEDDVTHMSLSVEKKTLMPEKNCVECKFWGLGGDGTIGANKNSIKMIGTHTKQFVQAYFSYDSKKSRGLTISHLRFGKSPIHAPYLIDRPDFAACHNPMYMHKYDIVQEIKDGGTFLLNCSLTGEALEKWLPGQVKRYLAKHGIRFFVIDGMGIGKEIGLNDKINTILQAAFFKLSGILPLEEAIQYMKEGAQAAYGRKGEKIVRMNFEAIEKGVAGVQEISVPRRWISEADTFFSETPLPSNETLLHFIKDIQKPIAACRGESLPVSAFLPYTDGSTPSGSTAYERRNVALDVPVWKPENCIQCNRCSYVCPHAVIRPAVMTKEECEKAPEGMPFLDMLGVENHSFSIVISNADCTGCGSCAGVCPGKKGKKALVMCPSGEHKERQGYFDYGKAFQEKAAALEKFPESTVKGSQFKKPFLEFHGACAGCGETTYPRLITQLYGERMYIANATGCSSIWGASFPSTPYTVNEQGQGPAWAHSLFEDGAEFGYGMLMSQAAKRERLKGKVGRLLILLEAEDTGTKDGGAMAGACGTWLETFLDWKENGPASERLVETLTMWKEACDSDESRALVQEILAEKMFLAKKSQWVFGGDGWAYDIGFGGLDHVLASGKDINVLVMDTEIYSNTGGQASKATPMGAAARFAVNGKRLPKKNLAAMAMNYGYVYVAQIAMGADFNQTLKAIREAESYHGPSLLIAYSPCISHGIKAGTGSAQHEEAKAVQAGYWHLFRFHPARVKEESGPLILDSKAPSLSYEEFLEGEIRFTSLLQKEEKETEELFEKAKEDVMARYRYLQRLETFYRSEKGEEKT